jgi:hypothetical protein
MNLRKDCKEVTFAILPPEKHRSYGKDIIHISGGVASGQGPIF